MLISQTLLLQLLHSCHHHSCHIIPVTSFLSLSLLSPSLLSPPLLAQSLFTYLLPNPLCPAPSRQVDYFNSQGSFKDKNTVEVIAKDGTSVSYHGNTYLNNVHEKHHLSIQKAITADTIVVAVGLRPRYPDVGVC